MRPGAKSNASPGVLAPDRLEMHEPADDQAVSDFTRASPAEHFVHRRGYDFDFLVMIPLRSSAQRGVFNEHKVATIVLDGGVRVYTRQQSRARSCIAGFLAQLAYRCLYGIFAGIDDTAGDLEGKLFDAEAKLTNEHKLPIGCNRDNITPIRRCDDNKIAFHDAFGMA